jgi:hypothetical protein
MEECQAKADDRNRSQQMLLQKLIADDARQNAEACTPQWNRMSADLQRLAQLQWQAMASADREAACRDAGVVPPPSKVDKRFNAATMPIAVCFPGVFDPRPPTAIPNTRYVRMIGPDGSEADVPADRVGDAIKRGAKIKGVTPQ